MLASEAAAKSKLELLKEENDRLRKQIKDTTAEKNNLVIGEGQQMQCGSPPSKKKKVATAKISGYKILLILAW